jgi:hypothetical protein
MSEWIYFIHPPRDDFATTTTDEEKAVRAVQFARLRAMPAAGTLILRPSRISPLRGRE